MDQGTVGQEPLLLLLLAPGLGTSLLTQMVPLDFIQRLLHVKWRDAEIWELVFLFLCGSPNTWHVEEGRELVRSSCLQKWLKIKIKICWESKTGEQKALLGAGE